MIVLAQIVFALLALTMGTFLILLPIQGVIEVKMFSLIIQAAQENIYTQSGVCLSGALIILLWLHYTQKQFEKLRREKTIVFEKPLGEVTITLNALEDVVKKTLCELSEIREIKPQIIASKKGITVALRTMLSSDVNIPEITSRIQMLVKDKLQQMLDIEEDILVRIDIKKILSTDQKKVTKEEENEKKPPIPYREF